MYSLISVIHLDRIPTELSDPRLLVGLLSAVVLLFGARLYRLVLVTPGFLVGVLVGLQVTAGGAPGTQVIAALSLGVIGAFALYMAERVAVALVGAVIVAGLARVGMPLILGSGLPWYVPAAAGVVGLFLIPSLLRSAIRLLTPLLGALGLTWALGRQDDPRIFLGLVLMGVLFQLFVLRPGGGREKEKDD